MTEKKKNQNTVHSISPWTQLLRHIVGTGYRIAMIYTFLNFRIRNIHKTLTRFPLHSDLVTETIGAWCIALNDNLYNIFIYYSLRCQRERKLLVSTSI